MHTAQTFEYHISMNMLSYISVCICLDCEAAEELALVLVTVPAAVMRRVTHSR